MLNNLKKNFAAALIDFFRLSKIILKLYPLAVINHFENIDRARIETIRDFLILNLYKINLQKRIGSVFDGGYVIVDDINSNDYCIAIGIGDDSTFENEMAEKCCKVLLFDHTIQNPQLNFANMEFFKKGISHKPSNYMMTLEEVLVLVPKEVDLILKIDVEGDEWDIFANLPNKYLPRFRQIIGEFHNIHLLSDPVFYEKVSDTLSKLTETHDLVNCHINNWSAQHLVQGVPLADVVELSFFRKTDTATQSTTIQLSSDLNAPNQPSKNDFEWSFIKKIKIT